MVLFTADIQFEVVVGFGCGGRRWWLQWCWWLDADFSGMDQHGATELALHGPFVRTIGIEPPKIGVVVELPLMATVNGRATSAGVPTTAGSQPVVMRRRGMSSRACVQLGMAGCVPLRDRHVQW